MKIGTIETDSFGAKKLYARLEKLRDAYWDRAKRASELTLPQVFNDNQEDQGSTTYATPFQSIGARGVNNLANKIVLSLFPPNSAFFKMGLNPSDMEALGKSQGDVEKSMYLIESSIIAEMEESSLRPKLIAAMTQGIIGGSTLIYIPDEGMPEVHQMDTFVVRRDKKGNILQLVLKESVNYLELSEDVKEQISKDLDENVVNGEKPLELYTVIVTQGTLGFATWQEINGEIIDGTTGEWSKEEIPYIYLPFKDTGENWGRSYVEDFLGDLQSYEGLRKSVLEAAAEAARIIYMLKPNSVTSLKALKKARSGSVLRGDIDDVGVLQSDKRMDLQVVTQESEVLRMDLASIFLLDSAVRRNAERVTAEEIRRVAQELEVALGGIYSTMSALLQKPLVRRYMARLVKKGKLQGIIQDSIEYEITTGSSALGRGTDFQTLTTFTQTLATMIPQEQLGAIISLPEYVRRLAYSLDVNTASLVKSEDEVQQEQQAQQQAAINEKVAPIEAKAQLEQ